jgi:hypothetical protein
MLTRAAGETGPERLQPTLDRGINPVLVRITHPFHLRMGIDKGEDL